MKTRACVSLRATLSLLAIGLGVTSVGLNSAAETVVISIPAAVGFAVTNVGVTTAGSPASGTVSFLNLISTGSHVLRISVKADSNFVPPSGTAIPASKVSWTTSGATNGTGSNGTLSTSAYGLLYQSSNGKKAGNVNVSWSLAAPGTPLRAGIHTLTVRWKLEAF